MSRHDARDWIAIRADASTTIGIGHVMRCLTLANALARHDRSILFLCRHLDPVLKGWIEAAGHHVLMLDTAGFEPAKADGEYGGWLGTTEAHDASSVIETLGRTGRAPLAMIVDHYALGATWEASVADAFACPILAMDDLRRHHACTMLVDTTFERHPDAYDGRVPEQCRRLVGAEYALLRDGFAEARASTLQSRDAAFERSDPVRTLLVAMGGGDPGDLTRMAVETLLPFCDARDIAIVALIGPAYPHRDGLTALARRCSRRFTIEQNVADVIPLLQRADLCVGAIGSASLERCCLGLPTIGLTFAENQKTLAQRLDRIGGIRHVDTADIVDACRALCDDVSLRAAMSRTARTICDGLGASKVAAALDDHLTRSASLP